MRTIESFPMPKPSHPNTFKHLALAMLLALQLACVGMAEAAPIPFDAQEADITAREQPLSGFLQDLFGRINVPVTVSASVRGSVNGHFSGSVEKTYQSIARSFNLVEYYDGSVLHIGTPQEMGTRSLSLPAASSARLMRVVQEMGLPDERNRMRLSKSGSLVLNGTSRFISQVEELARAEAPGGQGAAFAGFKVFYLRYAWAQDVTMNMGGSQVVVPGVASTLRAMMAGNPRSQVATGPVEPMPSPTVPRTRAQGQQARTGTLGRMDTDPSMSSPPALTVGFNAASQTTSNNPLPSVETSDGSQVRIEADPRLNAVLVRDTPQRMPQYEQLIAALDVEPQALEIEATIIDLNTAKLNELGVSWRYENGKSSLLFGAGDSSDVRFVPAPGVGSLSRGGIISAVLGNANPFIARIQALQEKGAARVVSQPQLSALSNVEAVFDNSQTFYVRVAGRDEVDLFNVSVGTKLRVMPHVFKERGEVRIKMLVSIEDGSLSNRIVDTLPVVDRSSINTQAMIFEGESLLLGGITRQSTAEDEAAVPGLGSIPVLGQLFRTNQSSSSRTERMILITPRLAGRVASNGKTPQAPVMQRPQQRQPNAAVAASQTTQAEVQPHTAAPIATATVSTGFRVQDRRGAKASYAAGDRYEVEVSVPNGGFLYCYLIDEQQRLHQFFPNPQQRSAAVPSASQLVFPGEFGFQLTASQARQRETVTCLNANKDLGFDPVPSGTAVDGQALRRQFSRFTGVSLEVGSFDVNTR